MWKTSTLLILGTLVGFGCASPQSKARDADEAQHDANQQAAYARQDTDAKDDAIRQKASEDSAQNARDGAKKSQDAQLGANTKSMEALASLTTARVDARDAGEKKLASLDKQFAELKPRLLSRLSKVESTTVVNDLTDKSDAVRRSIDDLRDATSDSLEPLKSTLARRIDAYERALEVAKTRG